MSPKHDAGTATRHYRAFWQRSCRAAHRAAARRFGAQPTLCGGSWRGDPPERCLSRQAGIVRYCLKVKIVFHRLLRTLWGRCHSAFRFLAISLCKPPHLSLSGLETGNTVKVGSDPKVAPACTAYLFVTRYRFCILQTAHRRFQVQYHCTGSPTAMVVPFSELSSTQTEPPWRSAISHTSESPSPAPPYSRLRDLSTRKKGWKMLC